MSSLDTQLIHDGEPDPRIDGAVVTPIFQSATFTHAGPNEPVRYARYNNTPNHDALHAKMASLEGTDAALVTGSGMAAIASVLMGLLSAGDHVVAQPGLYGGTLGMLSDFLPRFNIDHTFLPSDNPETWTDALRPSSRMLYAEGIANPRMDVANLEAMVDFAQAHDLITVIDNTFASPVNFRPAALGFDVVLHSATKYLAGHSDLIAGTVAGAEAMMEPVKAAAKMLGGTLDPHACFLLHRSLKTLAVRVRQQNANAQAVAAALADHAAIEAVRYPGLPDHPNHDRAARLFDGFGGMLSFDLVPEADIDAFFDALSLPVLAPSLGGVETLVSRPIHTSHQHVAPDVRKALGITKRFIRLSVGIEGTDDLVGDVVAALDAACVEHAR
jgi:cystathionine gamma-synthase/cystathionine gamma-lyase/cystathionine beta-lyase